MKQRALTQHAMLPSMKTVSLSRILAAWALCLPLWAQAGAIDQLHDFLKNTRTFKAEFAQSVLAKNGKKPQQSAGTLAIARPGKLRWEIAKPYPQLVVSDGEKVWIHDPDLQQVTVRKLGQAIGSSPAALLAGSNELERNFSLKEAGESEGLSWLEAFPKVADSGFEKVRLAFAGGELKAMELLDSFGQTTQVRFSHAEKNPVLPAGSFIFKAPPGTDVIGQ